MSRKVSSFSALVAVIGTFLCGGTAQASASARGITWGPCSDPSLKAAHAQCGFVSVPLDYSRPSGQQIQIAVSRIRHTSSAAHYQGVILTNPGGPGGSGLNLNTFLIPVLKQEGYKAAAADYDWIGFDPRGVGSSKPAISCIPNYFSPDRPSYIPTTSALRNHWLGQAHSYAQACDNASATQWALLRNMTTRDVARDMDRIREALGRKQITYYGFSYGTDLGQVYATMFPTHVRRLIMDSNVNLSRPGYDDFNLDQDRPFNRNLNIWFGWLAKYNSVYHLGKTQSAVKKLYYSTQAALASKPAGGQIGPDEWTDTFVETAYFEQTWVQWGQAFSDWVHKHDAAAAKELISLWQASDSPGNDNGFAVYSAVLCTDSPWPLDFSQWDSNVSAIYARAPAFAWWNAWFNAQCIFWPAPSSQLFKVNGHGIKSALLIDETLDAATPYSGSLEVRSVFPHAVLLAEPGGTSHADSLSGDKCVDGTIARYLETGALPKRKPGPGPDKKCAPLPRPVPSSNLAGNRSALPLSRLRVQGLRFGVPGVELR